LFQVKRKLCVSRETISKPGRNKVKGGRNKNQAERNKIKIGRNKIKIRFSFVDRAISMACGRLRPPFHP